MIIPKKTTCLEPGTLVECDVFGRDFFVV